MADALDIRAREFLERDLEVFRSGVDQLEGELQDATEQLGLREEELLSWEGHFAETARANAAKMALVRERQVRKLCRAPGKLAAAARAEQLEPIAEGGEEEEGETTARPSGEIRALSALLAAVAAEEEALRRAWGQVQLGAESLSLDSLPEKPAAVGICVKHRFEMIKGGLQAQRERERLAPPHVSHSDAFGYARRERLVQRAQQHSASPPAGLVRPCLLMSSQQPRLTKLQFKDPVSVKEPETAWGWCSPLCNGGRSCVPRTLLTSSSPRRP